MKLLQCPPRIRLKLLAHRFRKITFKTWAALWIVTGLVIHTITTVTEVLNTAQFFDAVLLEIIHHGTTATKLLAPLTMP